MEYAVEHETTYRYPHPIAESYTVVHLQPRTNLRQFCTGYALDVRPATRVFSYLDRFGNDVQHFSVIPEHVELRIVARSQVVTVGEPQPALEPVSFAALAADPGLDELYEFRAPSPYVALDGRVAELAAAIEAPRDDALAYFLAAGKFIHETLVYCPGATTVRSTIGEVLATGAGVCQDFAHLLVGLARAHGIPTRYASGYLFQGTGSALGAEASHAWAQAYLPPYGWIGYDPTNGRLVDSDFVLVACGRDYGDVSPTRGVYRGAGPGTLSVSVAIDPAVDQ